MRCLQIFTIQLILDPNMPLEIFAGIFAPLVQLVSSVILYLVKDHRLLKKHHRLHAVNLRHSIYFHYYMKHFDNISDEYSLYSQMI
jgi:hypothetical protein